MSAANRRRSRVRWARYVNHYAHISLVVVGGHAAAREISPFDVRWRAVRRQAKRPYAWAGRSR